MTSAKHVPERVCVVCRQKLPKRELVRIVRGPDGAVSIDPRSKRPGRGAYVCRRSQCWDDDHLHGRLRRALRCPLTTSQVEALRVDLASPVEERSAGPG